MLRKQWYAVRCCCTPTKIFGFLLLDAVVHPQRVSVLDRAGEEHKIKLAAMCRYGNTKDEVAHLLVENPRALMVERQEELAVYSEDRPREFWRFLVPTFVELPDVEVFRLGERTSPGEDDGPRSFKGDHDG